jgi:hypothetical protein
MILVLALGPPGRSHPTLPAAMLPARGALMQTNEHPEWRQFLILAAVRRADELNRMRELPDTPIRTESVQEAPKVAGLPTNRSNADAADETGTINEMPGVTIPVEIGETASTELPVTAPEEKSPVINTPERRQAPSKNRRKNVHRVRHAKAPAKPGPAAGSAQTGQRATARADQH